MSTYIDPVTETWIEQLQARIAELEAENAIFRAADYEALRAEKLIYCAKCRDGIVADDDGICGVCAGAQDGVIDSLQNKVAELKKYAIVWHKYPDEKPLIDGRYLFWDSDGNAPHVLPHNDIVVRDNPGVFSTQTHWAYLPAPPTEEQ